MDRRSMLAQEWTHPHEQRADLRLSWLTIVAADELMFARDGQRDGQGKNNALLQAMLHIACRGGYIKININILMGTGNYSEEGNNMRLVHWTLMGGLLHLVQRGGDWAGLQPNQAPPRCTKYNSPPINGQCTNHRIAI